MSYALLLEVMVEVGNIDMITEVMVHVERYHIVNFSLCIDFQSNVFIFCSGTCKLPIFFVLCSPLYHFFSHSLLLHALQYIPISYLTSYRFFHLLDNDVFLSTHVIILTLSTIFCFSYHFSFFPLKFLFKL